MNTAKQLNVIKFDSGIREYTETYFEELTSKNTRDAYSRDWERFLETAFRRNNSTIRKEELEQIDYDLIINYRRQLNLANSSINRSVNTIKSMLTYLKARKVIEIDLTFFDIIKPLKNKTKEIPHMPLEVVKEYMEEVKKDRFNGELKSNLIMFAVDSGLRLSEILKLSKSNFEVQGETVFVSGYGKGVKKYRNKISIKVYNQIINTYQENEEELLFYPLTNKVVKDMMVRLRKRLGYEKEGYSFHSLRKTSVTYTHDLTGDLLSAQRKANHSSPSTTNIYIENRDLEMTGFFSTQQENEDLFKEVSHAELLKAIEEMPLEFRQILNSKLKR